MARHVLYSAIETQQSSLFEAVQFDQYQYQGPQDNTQLSTIKSYLYFLPLMCSVRRARVAVNGNIIRAGAPYCDS